jgi:RND family efflux transporter MFP subunit
MRARVEGLRAAVASAGARGAEARAGIRLLEKRLDESVIRAPFAGRIAERHVDPGVIVSTGAPLVRVVATSPLRIRFDVPELEVAGLDPTTTVRVVTKVAAAAPGDGVAARITGVGAEVDRERRVAAIEAVIDVPPVGWLPGMYAEAIVDRRAIDGPTVPAPAVLSRLQPDGTLADGVLVADGETARWVPVTVLARDAERVAIQGAIEPNARVLVTGHVDLTDGAAIQILEDVK